MRIGRPTPVVLIVLAALFAATVTVTAIYRERRAARAQAHFEAGQFHAREGNLRTAVGEYRAALLLERNYLEAERALALALLSLGRLDESESYLTGLLQGDPVNGPLNLGLARILAKRGSDADAVRQYQRAIYGEWPETAPEGRLNARFELAEYLQHRGAREELVAELLRLKAELPNGRTAAERRLAHLFSSAGERDLAIDVLRTAAVHQPRDVALLADLAEAEAEAGRMSEARQTLRRAVALEPRREDLRAQLAVVERVLALDPTLPRLRVSTRARRARQLLRVVANETAACTTESDAVSLAHSSATARLQRRAPMTVDAADEDLTLALELWSAAAACRAQGTEADAISQVLERVKASTEDAQS